MAAAVLWAYWPTLRGMAVRWEEPQYSHGYLVPLFALGLLWFRRAKLAGATFQPSWWGVAVVAVAIALRWLGTHFYVDTLDELSLLPLLLGVCLLAGGWTALRWAWPAIGFLIFMVPLPFRLEVGLSVPLRHVATVISTYALQTLGFSAFSEGNVIVLNDYRIGVAEACSGLSMLMTFLALSCAVALVVKNTKPLDKAIIVLSAIPLALVTNILRIIVTAILYNLVGGHAAQVFFHDLAGWLMMPVALGLLYGELKLLKHLLIEPEQKKPLPLAFGTVVAANGQANPKKKRVRVR